ncbi:molybdopterin-dependent oxidoreductase [Orrella sp. JC864]|uniref:molybdopterin-dependent oxidoreductase n=1 Tax=Orrella sp. JC864 TaxID=3120298 RepID=UPI0012BC65EA
MTTRRTVLLAGASVLPLAWSRTARADCRSTLLTQDAQAAACPILSLYGQDAQARRLAAALTLEQLRSLPQTGIRTSLPANFQMRESVHWQGPTLAEVLRSQDLRCDSGVYAESLSGYGALVPATDLSRFDPILAWLRNGKPMSVRGNGPLLVIYPFDDHPALREDIHYLQRTVWQVRSLTAL